MTARVRALQLTAVALLATMAVGSLLMIVAGASPLHAWAQLLGKTLGERQGFGQVLFRATPLVFTGLAVAVPLRAGLFNIGGEGQLTAAALACAVVAAALPPGLPAPLAVLLATAVAFLAGAVVGAATGAMRIYRGAHEVIVAIGLNAIIAGVALWLGNRSLFVGESTRTATIPAAAQLPELGLAGSNASISVFAALAVAGLVAWLSARTRVGFTWRMTGQGLDAARAAGLPVDRARVWAMAVAGGLAGLAGAHFVLGHKHAYEDGLGRGVGFLGIAVALLAQGEALAIVGAALVFGVLGHGGLAISGDVPKEMVDVLQAVVVLVAAASLGRRRR